MKLSYDYIVEDLEEDSGARGEKFEVRVRFTVEGPTAEDAETNVNDIIQEGILRLLDTEDREPIYDYDIEEVDSVPL